MTIKSKLKNNLWRHEISSPKKLELVFSQEKSCPGEYTNGLNNYAILFVLIHATLSEEQSPELISTI